MALIGAARSRHGLQLGEILGQTGEIKAGHHDTAFHAANTSVRKGNAVGGAGSSAPISVQTAHCFVLESGSVYVAMADETRLCARPSKWMPLFDLHRAKDLGSRSEVHDVVGDHGEFFASDGMASEGLRMVPRDRRRCHGAFFDLTTTMVEPIGRRGDGQGRKVPTTLPLASGERMYERTR